MYCIFKLSDTWTLYDAQEKTSRSLREDQIKLLKELCPRVWIQKGKLILAAQIISINPNKISDLTNEEAKDQPKGK